MRGLFSNILFDSSKDVSHPSWIEGALDGKSCDGIVEFCSEFEKTNATVSKKNTDNGHVELEDYRNTEVAPIGQIEDHANLYQTLGDVAKKINLQFYNFELEGFFEDIQYLEYPAGAGFFHWHQDVGPGLAYRKLTLIVQLSAPEDYEGGDLQLMRSENLETLPKTRGTIICFPSFVLHRVSPVTKGTRKSLVAWLSGPPLR